jgi:hypothetical protein
MKELFELILCPQHGLLRLDNFQAVLVIGHNLVLEIGFYLRKAGIL